MLTLDELERRAYANGEVEKAALLRVAADLENQVIEMEEEHEKAVEAAREDTLQEVREFLDGL